MFSLTLRCCLLALFSGSLCPAVPLSPRESNHVTLPMTGHRKTAVQAVDLVKADTTRRLSFLKSGGSKGNSPATNAVSWYTVPVQVGTQTFELIVDTGSSNTWVGAGTPYVPGPASSNTGEEVLIIYGSAAFFGTEYNDTVTVGGLQVTAQSVGVATEWFGFTDVDGIIGFGPEYLTQFTVDGMDEVPTLMQNLVSQGKVSNNVIGVYFKPESGADNAEINGEITLGGTDSSKYSGSIIYSPITTADLYNTFWAVDVGALLYGSTVLETAVHPALVDTGTTYIYIPDAAYTALLSATGGFSDPTTSLAYFTSAPTEIISFAIGESSLHLKPRQYLVPAAQTAVLGLNNSVIWSYIANGGADGPDSGATFMIGQKLLENYYSAYDTDNNQVGFALRT